VALKQILLEIYKYIINVDALDAPNDIFVIYCDKKENYNMKLFDELLNCSVLASLVPLFGKARKICC